MLANIYAKLEKVPQAIHIYERILRAEEMIFGPYSLNTLRTLDNLSQQLAKNGNIAEALHLLQRVLLAQSVVLGSEHDVTRRTAKVMRQLRDLLQMDLEKNAGVPPSPFIATLDSQDWSELISTHDLETASATSTPASTS